MVQQPFFFQGTSPNGARSPSHARWPFVLAALAFAAALPILRRRRQAKARPPGEHQAIELGPRCMGNAIYG